MAAMVPGSNTPLGSFSEPSVRSALQIEGTPEAGEVQSVGSYWELVLRGFLDNRMAVAGMAILIAVFLFSFVGPMLWRVPPNQINLNVGVPPTAPTPGHPLGTDLVGRDVLARLMAGGQSSLEVGLAAAFVAVLVGVMYGAISGFFGGFVDTIMMRFVDVVLAIPILFLLIFLSTVVRPNEALMILVIGLTSWLVPARLIRGETLSLRTREYVQAVRVMGGSSWRIILKHILPNSVGTIIVNATFQVADAILLLAYLSYLGLGIPPPAATWGGLLSDGMTFIFQGAWWVIYPAGIAILITVVAFNFIGDAMRDALEVRLQSR